MSFTPEQLAQLRHLVVEAVREALTGGTTIAPPPVPDKVIIREDGAVQSTKLLDYKQSYKLSADLKRKAFADWIPEWFFVETPLAVTDRQKRNVHKNTNTARMQAGFLGFSDYVGPSSEYNSLLGWIFAASPIPDACSLQGNNGPGVPAVTLDDVPLLFDRLFERYKLSEHVPSWKLTDLIYPK